MKTMLLVVFDLPEGETVENTVAEVFPDGNEQFSVFADGVAGFWPATIYGV